MHITYTIARSSRRKTLSIIIRPSNHIDVLAPNHMPAKQIHQFIQDKQAWIQKKLHFNQEIRSPYQAKSFSQGESFHVLGQTYQLCISDTASRIHLSKNQLIVPTQQPEQIKQLLTRWYQQQAESHMLQRGLFFSSVIGKKPASISIKSYKSRWGSCHHDGRIYFNWRLIMAPDWIIDYVIVHELCHLIHHNHSKLFWQAVEKIQPDYRDAKTWLKINGLSLDF